MNASFLSRCILVAACLAAASCKSGFEDRQPPLRGVEEPTEAMREPEDEAARRALPPGSFSGVRVKSIRSSLDEEPEPGLEVAAVVENSPAAAAGIEVGDILLRATVGGATRQLDAPSDWRALELELGPGSRVDLACERGGKGLHAMLELVARVAPAPRDEAARFREDDKLGLVLRTATEVEARQAGLAPGAGVVLVGMATTSPWRGLAEAPRYGDLITALDGVAIDDPARFLAIVRSKEPQDLLAVAWRGAGGATTRDLPLSRRAQQLKRVALQPLFAWKREGERVSLSILLGAIGWERGAALWKLTVLWFFDLQGGDSDRLEEAS
ncbi:MAG: hypothetical protein ACK57N_05785 [Planctomycetia bacterium]